MPVAEAEPRLKFRAVDKLAWSDFERLFEGRGGPKNCWCTVWRSLPKGTKRPSRELRKTTIKKAVEAGTEIGIIGYEGDEVVAWCSIAPRETYRDLGGVNEAATQEAVWSLVCMYAIRRLRGKGITQQLIAAAVAQAKAKGATVIEAYPVDPDSPSYRFMGFTKSFEMAGFVEVGRAGVRRHIMRLLV